MNYYEKYLKYKTKYLNFRKQYGGIGHAEIKVKGTNSIAVNGLVGLSEYKTKLENFLNKTLFASIPLAMGFTRYYYPPSGNVMIINFEPGTFSDTKLKEVTTLINKFDEKRVPATSIVYSPSSGAPSIPPRIPPPRIPTIAPSRVSIGALPHTKFYEPWLTKNSKSLFVALVISPKTHLGTEIKARYDATGYGAPIYTTYDDYSHSYNPSGFLVDPHITLFRFSVPDGGDLDKVLSTDIGFREIATEIKNSYDKYINKPDKVLYSKLGHYTQLGNWIVREYTDNLPRLNILSNTDFEIFYNNLTNEIVTTHASLTTHIYNKVENAKRTPSLPSPAGTQVPTFTHSLLTGTTDTEHSYLATSSLTTNFKPHISLCNATKLTSTPDEFIKKFKELGAKNPISYLCLWSDRVKASPYKDGSGSRLDGNISHIHIAYGKKFVYIPV